MNLDEGHKEALWRLYARRTEREEEIFKRTFHRCLLKQRDEVITNLIGANVAQDALFDYKEAIQDFNKGFHPVIQHTVIAGAKQAVDLVSLLKQFGPEFLSKQALQWILRKSLALAKGVNRTTRLTLQSSLAEGFGVGESIPKLTKRVEKIYSQRYRQHARTVARTETIAASNYGALQGYGQAGVERVEFYVAQDERTCEDCDALNGKYFKLDDAEGLIPVHPNCRCTYLPAIPKEISERPPARTEGPSGDEWRKTLTSDEAGAMRGWTMDGYIDMRQYQRTGIGTPRIKKYTKAFEKGLKKDGSYQGEAWRGIGNLDTKTYNLIKNSKTIAMDATSSASVSSKIAATFAKGSAKNPNRIVFKIKSKTGVDFRIFGPGEQEILLGKGSKYKVIGQKRRIFEGLGKDKFDALEMTLVEI